MSKSGLYNVSKTAGSKFITNDSYSYLYFNANTKLVFPHPAPPITKKDFI